LHSEVNHNATKVKIYTQQHCPTIYKVTLTKKHVLAAVIQKKSPFKSTYWKEQQLVETPRAYYTAKKKVIEYEIKFVTTRKKCSTKRQFFFES